MRFGPENKKFGKLSLTFGFVLAMMLGLTGCGGKNDSLNRVGPEPRPADDAPTPLVIEETPAAGGDEPTIVIPNNPAYPTYPTDPNHNQAPSLNN